MNQELQKQIEELNDRQQVLFLRLLTAATETREGRKHHTVNLATRLAQAV